MGGRGGLGLGVVIVILFLCEVVMELNERFEFWGFLWSSEFSFVWRLVDFSILLDGEFLGKVFWVNRFFFGFELV